MNARRSPSLEEAEDALQLNAGRTLQGPGRKGTSREDWRDPRRGTFRAGTAPRQFLRSLCASRSVNFRDSGEGMGGSSLLYLCNSSVSLNLFQNQKLKKEKHVLDRPGRVPSNARVAPGADQVGPGRRGSTLTGFISTKSISIVGLYQK